MTELQNMMIWVSGISTVIALATTIWNMMTSGSRSNAKIIALQAARIDELERRVDKLHNRLDQVPSFETMHRLELTMRQIEGGLEVLTERLKPLASMTERMQEFLLANSKERT